MLLASDQKNGAKRIYLKTSNLFRFFQFLSNLV